MGYCGLQIGCIIVLFYIAFIYCRQFRKYHRSFKETFFDELLTAGIICVAMDGITAFTVNHTDFVNPLLNRILHILFFISVDSVMCILFMYLLYITGAFPKKKPLAACIFIPLAAGIAAVIVNIGSLEFVQEASSGYPAGVSVYVCLAVAFVYVIMTTAAFFKRLDCIDGHKRAGVLTYLLIAAACIAVQLFLPDILTASLAVTVCVLGVYMNQENPALGQLSRYHDEMMTGFANLIESRDDSTGGHVKRTGIYAKLIAEELCKRGYYSNTLTKEYIINLQKAAPMHDIGKISVPDAILQKPGKLNDDEYIIMKLHAEKGGKIIQETFADFEKDEYSKMAYEVARFHHEKWNGNGYPQGLTGEDIPLCARIMAVADVFDAVSEKRCYRDAIPIDQCFDIIEQGSGSDFDPLIAETFLDMKDKVEAVHNEFRHEKEAVEIV